MTIEQLKEWGANTEEGLTRCFGNESLYLKLVSMVSSEGAFEKLKKGIDEGNMEASFEAAHALKGVLGNLSLTPLYNKVVEITELLRAKENADYKALVTVIFDFKKSLDDLLP